MTHNLRTRLVATCTAALLVVTSACQVAKDYGRPLPEGAPALLPLDPGEAPPRFGRHPTTVGISQWPRPDRWLHLQKMLPD